MNRAYALHSRQYMYMKTAAEYKPGPSPSPQPTLQLLVRVSAENTGQT